MVRTSERVFTEHLRNAVRVASPSMATSLLMRTSSSRTPALVSSLWLTLAPTPTVSICANILVYTWLEHTRVVWPGREYVRVYVEKKMGSATSIWTFEGRHCVCVFFVFKEWPHSFRWRYCILSIKGSKWNTTANSDSEIHGYGDCTGGIFCKEMNNKVSIDTILLNMSVDR